MIGLLIKHESMKTENTKRWLHVCGRQDVMSLNQITYICSLHFIKDNPDPIIATSLTILLCIAK